MTTVIKVENLGKKYLIGHEKQERYSTLRDSISYGVQSMARRLRHPLQANKDTTELEEFWALKDINFKIQQGDKVGIIGRNGAGKSTLLKILSRITAPTTGKITIKGRVASLLEVGTGFHPELSGRENIYLNGAILGMRKAEIKRKFDEIVDFAEVEKFLDTPVKRYSSGMYVRLAFAVAAHLEPEILIVDEVLAVGDAQFQKKCLGKMEEVSQEGRTILFVSHNMGMIQKLCSSAILLKSATIQSIGSVNNIIENYLSTSTNDLASKLNKLDKIPRTNSETGEILITECQIFDVKGECTHEIRYGDTFSVMITAQARRDYNRLSLVVALDDNTGTRIFTSVSGEYGVTYSIKKNEYLNGNVSFTGLILTPGFYRISLSIRQDIKHAIDTLKNVASIQVLDISANEIETHSGVWGAIHAPSIWI